MSSWLQLLDDRVQVCLPIPASSIPPAPPPTWNGITLLLPCLLPRTHVWHIHCQPRNPSCAFEVQFSSRPIWAPAGGFGQLQQPKEIGWTPPTPSRIRLESVWRGKQKQKCLVDQAANNCASLMQNVSMNRESVSKYAYIHTHTHMCVWVCV